MKVVVFGYIVACAFISFGFFQIWRTNIIDPNGRKYQTYLNSPSSFSTEEFGSEFFQSPVHLRCDFPPSTLQNALIRRAYEQKLRFRSFETGSSDPFVVLPNRVFPLPNPVVKLDFKFSSKTRTEYVTKASEVNQGSFHVEPVLAVLAYMSKIQASLNVRGAIGEIGVHHGKFFVGLAHLARIGERLWACDVFENQALNVDGSGFGDKQAFLRACETNGITQNMLDVVSGSSTDISNIALSFRLISVDGGHTRELTFNDLTLAACHLEKGGIIILDDVTNLAWGGVIDAMFTWTHYFPVDFGPFFVGYNKVFLADRSFHDTYYRAMVKYASNAPAGMRFSLSPDTNLNPHKSIDSGSSMYLWSGYRYVFAGNDFDNTIAVDEWRKQIS
mmetsp:Transcript_7876/g.14948  ORF Transcript_7876/g.14948 Transcript_7876/m.14948 type:complete len:388 (-) Transcript_7876:362-1525(-)